MRTNYVFIDLENVQPQSLDALAHDHFKVIVFVGDRQQKLSFELAAAMQRLGGKAEYVKIAGMGRNALDFHIAFHIGRISAGDPTGFYHIISKDTGYDPLIQHLKAREIFSARSASISEIPIVKAADKKSPEERAKMFAAKLQQPKATRPRTEQRLIRAVAAFFQKQLSGREISEVVAAMVAEGFLSLSDGKVSYAADG